MQQEKPTALLASLFSPRNLIFAVMALATAAYILQRAEGTNLGEGVADKLRDKQFRLVVRMFVYQAALARTNPEPVRTQLANQLVTQLDQLEATGEFFEGPRLLQKFIVLGYLGRSPAVKVIPPIVDAYLNTRIIKSSFAGGKSLLLTVRFSQELPETPHWFISCACKKTMREPPSWKPKCAQRLSFLARWDWHFL